VAQMMVSLTERNRVLEKTTKSPRLADFPAKIRFLTLRHFCCRTLHQTCSLNAFIELPLPLKSNIFATRHPASVQNGTSDIRFCMLELH